MAAAASPLALTRTGAELRLRDRPNFLAVTHEAARAVCFVTQGMRRVEAVFVVYFAGHHCELLVGQLFTICQNLQESSEHKHAHSPPERRKSPL